MANKIFKNERSFFGRIEAFYWRLWAVSGFRFLVIGGINSLVGIIVTILLRLLFENVFHVIVKWDVLMTQIDIPYLTMYLLLFSYSYFMMAKFVFRTPWNLGRNFLYLLSSLPNFLLQQLFIWLFEGVLVLPYWLSYTLAAIAPIPIMYFINKFLVVPMRKKKDDGNTPA